MSAWYIFSSIGFYPVCPGSGEYAIGSPSVNESKIQLEGDKHLVIKAKNLSEKNIYIQSASLNGKSLNKSIITNQEVRNGGLLILEMGKRPNKKWGLKI